MFMFFLMFFVWVLGTFPKVPTCWPPKGRFGQSGGRHVECEEAKLPGRPSNIEDGEVVQRGAMGSEADHALLAHTRVPLAGGAHSLCREGMADA